jgi:hypothetical protein
MPINCASRNTRCRKLIAKRHRVGIGVRCKSWIRLERRRTPSCGKTAPKMGNLCQFKVKGLRRKLNTKLRNNGLGTCGRNLSKWVHDEQTVFTLVHARTESLSSEQNCSKNETNGSNSCPKNCFPQQKQNSAVLVKKQ